MTHITNIQLNEYLDGQLDGDQQQVVEAHLAVCGTCRAELADLQALFAELAALPEVAFDGNVAEEVVSELNQQEAFGSWPVWLLAIQAAVGMGLMALLWPSIQWLLRFVSETTETAVITLQPQPRLLWQDMIADAAATVEQLQMGWQLDIPFEQWAWVVLLALVIWIVGNRLLLVDLPQNNQV